MPPNATIAVAARDPWSAAGSRPRCSSWWWPFLSFAPASALWLAPPFAIRAGGLDLPIVPVVLALVLVVALVGQVRPRNDAAAGLNPGAAAP